MTQICGVDSNNFLCFKFLIKLQSQPIIFLPNRFIFKKEMLVIKTLFYVFRFLIRLVPNQLYFLPNHFIFKKRCFAQYRDACHKNTFYVYIFLIRLRFLADRYESLTISHFLELHRVRVTDRSLYVEANLHFYTCIIISCLFVIYCYHLLVKPCRRTKIIGVDP